jgi:hypothetical protein
MDPFFTVKAQRSALLGVVILLIAFVAFYKCVVDTALLFLVAHFSAFGAVIP